MTILMAGIATFAADTIRGTPAEAKTMLADAVAYYKAVGRRQAFADFTAKEPPFGYRDLYVFCFGADHIVLANGGFPYDVGNRGDTVRDINGKGIATAAWDLVRSKNDGVVRYRWANPKTHVLEWKNTFFAKVGDAVCGVGVYSPTSH
jgi:cytochrome c